MDAIENFNAKSKVESNIIQDFHDKRLLFIIIKDKLYIEYKPSGMSHIEWISTLDIKLKEETDYILNSYTRGYYYEETIVFYIGLNFSVNELVVNDFKKYLKEIFHILNISPSTEIGLGCIPVKNTIFKPIYKIGTINDIEHKNLDYINSILK